MIPTDIFLSSVIFDTENIIDHYIPIKSLTLYRAFVDVDKTLQKSIKIHNM